VDVLNDDDLEFLRWLYDNYDTFDVDATRLADRYRLRELATAALYYAPCNRFIDDLLSFGQSMSYTDIVFKEKVLDGIKSKDHPLYAYYTAPELTREEEMKYRHWLTINGSSLYSHKIDSRNLVLSYIIVRCCRCGVALQDINLNWIDTSGITKMNNLFCGMSFCGDISLWDVSNVTNMDGIFMNSGFKGIIDKWDVSNVKTASYMFYDDDFRGDISMWDFRSLENANTMFGHSKFNGDISKWRMPMLKDAEYMFSFSGFQGDLSSWMMPSGCKTKFMFLECRIDESHKPQFEDE